MPETRNSNQLLFVYDVLAAALSVRLLPQPMDGMQKAVAKNMGATLDVPVFRVSRKIRTDAFDEVYRQIKPKGVTVRRTVLQGSHPRLCGQSVFLFPVNALFNHPIDLANSLSLNTN